MNFNCSSCFPALLAVVLACAHPSNGFVAVPYVLPTSSRVSTILFSGNSDSVASFSLKGFQNHEEEGEKMAKSIAAWLDSEWMPQEVHNQMASSAKKSYIECREAGEDDLMEIMTTIADDLNANWEAYDADAFINAWDIVNYVSDYLVQASGGESCDCSSKIF